MSVVHLEPSGFGARVEISEAGVPDGAGSRNFSAPCRDDLIDTLALAIGSRSARAVPSPTMHRAGRRRH